MAIAFRSVASTFSNVGLSSPFNFQISRPAGVVAGDLMLACVMIQNQQLFDSNPPGWSTLGFVGGATGSTGAGMKIMYRVAGGAETTAFAWSMDGACDWAGAILAYSGVDQATPINASASTRNIGNTTSCVAPSVAPSVANAMLVAAFGCNPNTATTGVAVVYTPPAGMTERHDSNIQSSTSTTLNCSLSVAELALATTAATGAKTALVSNNGHTANWAIVLAPATTSPPPSTAGSTQMIPVRRLPREAAQRMSTVRSSFH